MSEFFQALLQQADPYLPAPQQQKPKKRQHSRRRHRSPSAARENHSRHRHHHHRSRSRSRRRDESDGSVDLHHRSKPPPRRTRTSTPKSRRKDRDESDMSHEDEDDLERGRKSRRGRKVVDPPASPESPQIDDSNSEPTTPPPLQSTVEPKVPIPIQHCVAPNNVLQRPAMPTEGGDDEDEIVRGATFLRPSIARPQSLKRLVTAVRKGKGKDFEGCDAILERRIRDFEQARWLRRAKYQENKPWGIFGLFAHLSDLRMDLEWAEVAAWKRANGDTFVSWNDFEKEHVKNFNRPIFTTMIILISTALMFYTMALANWKFAPLTTNPMFGPSPDVLLQAGALHTYSIVVQGEWYRLFAPIFLHAGLVHFFLNMLAIWFIGGSVEKCHGFANLACLFIISAVGGNILSAVFQPRVISVGASGGIFGLVGVVLADIFVNWDLLFLQIEGLEDRNPCANIQVLLWLGFDMAINIIVGLTPFIDNFAHMGGLLYGIFYALPLVDRLGVHFFGKLGLCFQFQSFSLRAFGFIAGSILLMVSSLMLMNSDGLESPCEKCRFISCAPFPFWKEDKWWDCDIP